MSQAGGVGDVACALVVCQVRPTVSAILHHFASCTNWEQEELSGKAWR